MKIIDRYVLGEVLIVFAGVLSVLTFIISLGKISQSVELILGRGTTLTDTLTLILLLLPSSLQFTIPIALLVSILIVVGRISGDNELTVLKSSGVSLFRFSAPFIAFSAAMMIVSFAVTFIALPYCNDQTRKLIFGMIQKQASLCVEEGRFTDALPGILIYANRVKQKTNEIENVFISDERIARRQILVVAKRAVLSSDDEKMVVALHLFNGSLHMMSEDYSYYRRADFATYTVSINWGIAARSAIRTSTEMKFYELLEKAKTAPEGPFKREMEMEINKRITVPLACMCFCFIALPLGIRAQRTVRSRGFLVGFSLTLGYFLLGTGGEALAGTGKITPMLAAWTPLTAFSCIGFLLYYLAGREIFTPSLDFLPKIGKFRSRHRL